MLGPWWQAQGNPDWMRHRRRILELLEQEQRLERMARVVGQDALPPTQQLSLLSAELINEAFLRQSAFSPVDRYCSPKRQSELLHVVLHFVERAEQALDAGVNLAAIRGMAVQRQLMRASEDIPEDKEERFARLTQRIDEDFDKLVRESADAA